MTVADITAGILKMSTGTTDPRSTAALPETITVAGEERHVMRGATWRFYDWLTDALGERAPFRVAYLRLKKSRGGWSRKSPAIAGNGRCAFGSGFLPS